MKVIEEAGHLTASADEIARALRAEPEHAAMIRRLSGLPENAGIEALRTVFWSDPAVKRRVSDYVVPRVVAALRAHPAHFHEIPLLIENARQMEYDRIWVVACEDGERLRRLIARDGDEGRARAAMRAQLPSAVKEAFAHATIRTERPPEAVREEVRRLLEALRAG